MRDIPAALAAHLTGGATTLCHCWRLIRPDGAVLGFTDHDVDLAFEGTSFAAGTGLEAAEASTELGFVVGGGDVSGALVSAGITEADILAGRYDDAAIETWLVNWAAPDQRLLVATGSIGEIRRADAGFVAEIRGPLHRFDEERGLIYRRTCSADLGDGRCRVTLDGPAYSAEASVATSDGALTLGCPALSGYAIDWFTGGRLVWLSGANAGATVEIKAHRVDASGPGLDLWQRMPAPIVAGDTSRVTAGCDKRLATCGAKFGNVPNFRGFPHMPGNDFVLAVAAAGDAVFDGGSLFQ
jgi:uncharacterized phage protein (TIGR02218 family)